MDLWSRAIEVSELNQFCIRWKGVVHKKIFWKILIFRNYIKNTLSRINLKIYVYKTSTSQFQFFKFVEIFVESQLHLPFCQLQTRCTFYYTLSEDSASLREISTSQFKLLRRVTFFANVVLYFLFKY